MIVEMKQLKEQNEILNEHFNECETALDETIQRLADADCPAIKLSENKALINQTEKSIQHQFNIMQINFKNMIDEKFNSNVFNNGNRILSYTSATTVDDNKRTRKLNLRNGLSINNDDYIKTGIS